MIEVFSLIGVLICLGLFVYYRYTDSRNVTLQTLKDYLKQSEKHIEFMLRKKEKYFDDKMIASEIVIDRMHKLAGTLQEKLDLFDKDIIQGQELYNALKQELNTVHDDLYEYKQIRNEFRNIEDRIESILAIKKQAEDGTTELKYLKEKINAFSGEFEHLTESIKADSKGELDRFFQAMQNDLSDYLAKAKYQLSEKDTEMSQQIQELNNATNSMAESIQDFKEYAENSINQLKSDCENDFEMVRSATESNITDIYDMWEKIKEQTQQDTDGILTSLNNHKEFFDNAEEHLTREISNFDEKMSLLTEELQTNLSFNIQEKTQNLDKKLAEIFLEIEKRGHEVQNKLEDSLNNQTNSVKEELERVYSAFVEQEQAVEEKIKVIGQKVNERVTFAEKEYQENIQSLNHNLSETEDYVNNILQEARNKVEEKISLIEDEFRKQAQENIVRVEENFKEANQERIVQSINDISGALQLEFKQKYQEDIENVFIKAEELEDAVKNKFLYVEELEQKFKNINDEFNLEKEKIILMCQELEKDRDSSKEVLIHQINEHLQELQGELTTAVQDFLEQGSQNFIHDQELWKERFDEIVHEGREEYYRMKKDVENIHRSVSNIEDNSLNGLKREAEKIAQEARFKMDDLKTFLGDVLRSSKEELNTQTDQARQELKEIKQDLWDQEKEMQQVIQKDLDRVNVKIKEIDKQYINFVKKSERLDKVEELVRKISQQYSEVEVLKKEIDHMSFSLANSQHQGKEIIQELQNYNQQLDHKTEELKIRSSEADRVQEFLISAIKEADHVKTIFSSLTEEKIKAKELEELLLKNLEVFNELQDSLNVLESKRELVDDMMSVIDRSETNMSEVSVQSDEVARKVQEISHFVQDTQDKMITMQKEMRELAGDQTQIRTAVSKLHDLEHIVLHIDEEMKRLEKIRDWIARSMNNIERISSKGNLGSFQEAETDVEDSNVKNVLRLYKTGWSIGDIAKNLKVSPAYVELIIERYKS